MEHNSYKQYITLWLYDELNPEQIKDLSTHLMNCAACTRYYEEEKSLHKLLDEAALTETNTELLREARTELRATLRKKAKENPVEKLLSVVADFLFTSYKPVLGGLALITIGFIAGNFYNQKSDQNPMTVSANMYDLDALMESGIKISDVKLIDNKQNNGEVEISFQAKKNITLKGSLKEKNIQSLMMYSILNEGNAGIRLNTINLIGNADAAIFDQDIKTTILSVVQFDENPAVRKEALKIIRSIPFDTDVKYALLHVLKNDKNSGNRIEAINTLLEMQGGIAARDTEVRDVLRKQMESEKNNYIQYKVKSVLDEKVYHD